MKKMIAIIVVLAIIFTGTVIYTRIERKERQITATEVEQIEQTITKVYMWKEITQEALPSFEEINQAPDNWLWQAVKKNLEDYELTYEQIQEKAIELFGTHLEKKFPKEGTQYLTYDQEKNCYYATSIELDQKEDNFLLNQIQKTKEGYEVEIIEYIEDYSKVDSEQMVILENKKEEPIAQVEAKESETKTIEQVKENVESFSKKKIKIQKQANGTLLITEVIEE